MLCKIYASYETKNELDELGIDTTNWDDINGCFHSNLNSIQLDKLKYKFNIGVIRDEDGCYNCDHRNTLELFCNKFNQIVSQDHIACEHHLLINGEMYEKGN